jgi:hypothetical protein
MGHATLMCEQGEWGCQEVIYLIKFSIELPSKLSELHHIMGV